MKKRFKLIAVILIVLQLSMLCGSCYAKTASKVSYIQNNLFKSLVIPQFNMSIDEWMSTAEDRAYFTIAIAAELHNYLASGFDGPAAFHNPSFIGRVKHLIAVYLNDNAHQVFLLYNSLNDEITISYLDGIKEDQVPGVFKRNCSEYYRNEKDVILRLALGESYSTSGIESEVFSTQEVYSFESNSMPSPGEADALEKAKSLLSSNAFSYTGLIEQLEGYDFSNSEATYAANNCGADWNEQALKKAKRYLSKSVYSYKRLINQLEYSGFTASQAKYGADNCGANWNEQAVEKAKSYLKSSSNWTKSRLISQLVEVEGYTSSEASYAVDNCGKSW